MRIAKLTMLTGIVVVSLSAAGAADLASLPYNGELSGARSSSGWAFADWGFTGLGGAKSKSTMGTSSSSISTISSSSNSSSGGTAVPESSNMAMLALGVAGLVAGRIATRQKRKKK
jgi:hypothetical protein